ncbi:uncharacterized protein LOC128597666 isoform X1 [Nycticebus coucang]|uniref:uncharacterized protein LOC128597666 isoform X1 n=1 Tax=Nycticebus coucang TaxID=9470 RepID=UPI00234CC02C|nr:uncharacterized protein LOC128597666 isoform X1 [Nycticebus coucang]
MALSLPCCCWLDSPRTRQGLAHPPSTGGPGPCASGSSFRLVGRCGGATKQLRVGNQGAGGKEEKRTRESRRGIKGVRGAKRAKGVSQAPSTCPQSNPTRTAAATSTPNPKLAAHTLPRGRNQPAAAPNKAPSDHIRSQNPKGTPVEWNLPVRPSCCLQRGDGSWTKRGGRVSEQRSGEAIGARRAREPGKGGEGENWKQLMARRGPAGSRQEEWHVDAEASSDSSLGSPSAHAR